MLFRHLSSCASTSDELRRLLPQTRDALILSDCQTGGRGRTGHSFYSPAGGLYFSCAFELSPQKAYEYRLTAAAAVAVCRSLEACGAAGLSIKWVNDIFRDGRKIGGILTEGTPAGVIVGIGINLAPCPLPDGLREIVGFAGISPDREALALNIYARIKALLQSGGFEDEYKARSCVLGKKITFPGGCGIARDINGRGDLLVDCGGRLVRLFSGEISVKL